MEEPVKHLSQTCPNVISSRKPLVTPSARTAAPHTCGGPIHIDGTVDGPPGAMPFGGSRDSSLLCVLMVLVVIQLLSCPTLNSSMDCNTPGFPVLHYLPEFVHTRVHWVDDAIQPSHPLLSPSPAFNFSQLQVVFQWVSSLHQVAKALELQL